MRVEIELSEEEVTLVESMLRPHLSRLSALFYSSNASDIAFKGTAERNLCTLREFLNKWNGIATYLREWTAEDAPLPQAKIKEKKQDDDKSK